MHILKDHQFRDADISIAVVDDPTIHQLNRQWLGHDWPTDVLSFPLTVDPRNGRLDGEIVASLDTAVRTAPRLGWSAEAELTLYVIHGMLHLVGFDDHSPDQRRAMRGAERKYLARVGIKPPRKVAAVSRRHRPGGGA